MSSPYRFCLWGARDGYVQIGSELDRAIWLAWRADLPFAAAFARLRLEQRDREAAWRSVRMAQRFEEMSRTIRKATQTASASIRQLAAGLEALHRSGVSIKDLRR